MRISAIVPHFTFTLHKERHMLCNFSISENQSLVVMRPWWNMWLIGAVVVSMALHFVILEISFLAVSSTH